MTTLVLSPHADDAALSIGGSLLLQAYPTPVTVVTVFSQSSFGYGQLCADTHAVTAKRHEEDAAFAALCSAHLLSLDFPDAPLRLGPGAETVFASGPSEAVLQPEELEQRLARVVADAEVSCLLAPLGLGCHFDHLLVQRAAVALAREHALELILYEDLPYAVHHSREQITAQAGLIDPDFAPLEIPIEGVMAAKLKALKCYPSQLGEVDASAVRLHARRCHPHRHAFSWLTQRRAAYERVWVLGRPRWLQAARRLRGSGALLE